MTANSSVTKQSVTLGDNSQYRLSLNKKKGMIKETVEKSPYPITPKGISEKTGIKHATVKKYVRELEKEGLVKRRFYGHYISGKSFVTLESRVGGSDLRVHSLRLRCGVVGGVVRRWVVRLGDVVVLRFFVHENGTATVFVNCVGDVSLDPVSWSLVCERVFRELGFGVEGYDQVSVANCEFNRDFRGVKLDGFQAVTVMDFNGNFRRMYNKGFGLRDEVKVNAPLSMSMVAALLNGGVSASNFIQLSFLNFQKMKEYVEAAKLQNRLLMELVGQNRRLIEAIFDGKRGASSG